MRQAKDQDGNNRIFREIQNFIDRFRTQNLDMGGKKIINAGAGTAANDYATIGQLPRIPDFPREKDQFYEIVWNNDGPITNDQVISSYIVGKGREGVPLSVYICTDDTGIPSADCSVNLSLDGVNILDDDLVLPLGEHGPVFASNFIDPLPKLPSLARIKPIIVEAGGASFVTICLTVKRTL